MRVEIQLRIVSDDETMLCDDAVLRLDRAEHRLATLGVSLAEAKTLLANVQNRLVAAQAADHVARHRSCPACGRPRPIKGYETVVFRTAFGVVRLPSPRLVHCRCQAANRRTFCPLTGLLTEHTAPELLYLESKWASLVSYGLTADLLKEVLPVGTTANASTIRNHLHKVARRCDAGLGPEQVGFIDGCPADWKELPVPEGPIVVGLDGGYVRNWDDRKASFEVIVGKSVPENREHRYFGCVQTVDNRPKRRIFEVLRSQGLQMNQDLVFLTDGGDNLHALVDGFSPCAEHYLDWFHITMSLTVLGQYAKGLAHHNVEEATAMQTALERIKWRLWHGDAREALIRIEDLAEDLDVLESGYPNLARFAKATAEFATYIRSNRAIIPNYGERRHNDEPISTAFVESTVNVVVDKRFAKKQQMQWSKVGAHRMVQIRTRTLDGTLRETFAAWYPAMAANAA
ncbi:ISKra4 family transposase [Azospirillum argentinense]|uniref:ISKra4 family transposase n=1 Tax=Azospirillum argentinense TaxID=2970906 RepID=A0A5B0KNT1_9PROT|nr:ISKra4 family transposase [Azospirillum argentinense]KAA1053949.1 hypothetical protein FH063_002184 [Azospirillum argentinense]